MLNRVEGGAVRFALNSGSASPSRSHEGHVVMDGRDARHAHIKAADDQQLSDNIGAHYNHHKEPQKV